LLDPGDPRPEVAASLRAWLALQARLGLRPQEAVRVLERAREPRAALRLLGGPPTARVDLERAVAALRRVGAVAVPWLSSAYPERARRLSDAPPLLLVRGDPTLLEAPAVAIVGSRAATSYGRRVAHDFAGELAAAGLVVISGLATGIDAEAHRGALEAGGRTLAVQACGPDRVYPARHRSLSERIVRSGAVVTEFAPGTRPRRGFFPHRNRLISAMSLVVLVVEARERSGSLVTAAHAGDQGVPVWAVPGPLSAPTSAGTNRLLFEGASPALSPGLILESLGLAHALPERASPAPAASTSIQDAPHPGGCAAPSGPQRSDAQRRIVAALREEPMTRDRLLRRLGVGPEALASDLLELELDGSVAEDRDGLLRVVSAR